MLLRLQWVNDVITCKFSHGRRLASICSSGRDIIPPPLLVSALLIGGRMLSHLARAPHCVADTWVTLKCMFFFRTIEARTVSLCLEGPDVTARLGVSNSPCAGTSAAEEIRIDTSNSRAQEEYKANVNSQLANSHEEAVEKRRDALEYLNPRNTAKSAALGALEGPLLKR